MTAFAKAIRRFAPGVVAIVVAGAGCTQILGLDGDFKKDASTSSGTAGGGSGSVTTGTGSSTSSASGSSGSTGSGGAPPRTVTGTESVTHVYFNSMGLATDVVHPDLTGVAITVLVPEGNSFAAPIAGVGAANGTFTVSNVPSGPYYLNVGDSEYENSYFVTSEDAVDLSYYVLGRDDASPATLPTPLTLNATNLSSWINADRLELVSAGANAIGLDLTANSVVNPPTTGATSLAMTIDSSKLVSPYLIESGEGDAAGLLQLVRQTTPVTYLALQRFGLLSAVNQSDGIASSASISLSNVNFGTSATVNWHTTAFEAQASEVNPYPALAAKHEFKVQLELGDPSYGIYSLTPDIVTYLPAVFAGDVDVVLPYGNPISTPPWYAYESVSTTFEVPQSTPGGTVAPSPVLSFYAAPKTTFEASEPIDPPISPPTSPTVDGGDFFADDALASATPTFAWSPPTTGTPTSYLLRVFSLTPAAKRTLVGQITTSGTSVTIPPGMLQSGVYYIFTVRATQLNGVDFEKTPARETLPLAYAHILSGVRPVP